MEFSGVVVPEFSFPEKYKVFQHGECYIEAIKKSISQEENEEFVVGKVNAIVDPWAMVIHFTDTFVANAAMMSSVRLHMLTFLTKSNAIIYSTIKNGKIGCEMLKKSGLFLGVLSFE